MMPSLEWVFVLTLLLSLHVGVTTSFRVMMPAGHFLPTRRILRLSAVQQANYRRRQHEHKEPIIWTPQDLTQNVPGYVPIPDDDYVKLYQTHPELWPVEFFVIAYRRRNDTTELLVRKSANGTAQWGLGTGVPITRWILSSSSSSSSSLPTGYEYPRSTRITLNSDAFPEFPRRNNNNHVEPWTYQKINLRHDAFEDAQWKNDDPKLEEYAEKVTQELRTQLNTRGLEPTNDDDDKWESTRCALIKRVVEQSNCRAAIQGTFRMSGLLAAAGKKKNAAFPDPQTIVQSMRVYTMFPQMPDPMPLPSTSPEELQNELQTRQASMKETGRDPHKDKHGRIYTHISTSNVSNTIHGIYFPVDVTDLLTDDAPPPPAYDLFGTQTIQRHWKSLSDLKVLTPDKTSSISTEDPKSTFISGFIVRQLVKEGVIPIV